MGVAYRNPLNRALAILAGVLLLSSCAGRQSVLDPAGIDALSVYDLARVMFIGAIVLWLMVGALFIYATRIRPQEMPRRTAEMVIIGGGLVFPVLLLSGLLVYSLPMMGAQRVADDGMRVHVTAEQWWWRVEYELPGDERIVSANELRLPVGARTGLVLNAKKVIHSFWVPALGGKTDMIPGRETFMSLAPERPGVYRGQCAEFCGASHALMAFETVVMAPQDFAVWLAAEAGDAVPPATPQAIRGARVFAREGCGACHAIRGTAAIGQVGPDLTHIGTRASLAAGTLGTTPEDFARWLGHAEDIKPEVAMPTYDYLSPADLAALVAYLKGLT
ncbi:cytochrome c oxidase subunit 2 [Antarctobacter heliothermus]|uniref:Cytochrome c oxidase subunit 2 n=1 Tax=Antarctobacter heliothermus TaxID=74033 RepID=A0A222E539_9RHOB|nr:cytochrome c oxidase subunit II [Antarctobacter heliothermus]ASP21303.1 cytochrome c oxidase subunit 2 [Antarctobacter heliothermus]